MTNHRFVYLNGVFTKTPNASISLQDRGFRFGDGVFETICIASGNPYRLAQHLARLSDGLNAIRINADTSTLPALCAELIEKNNAENCILRIIITRGIGSRGYMPADISQPPTILIETQDFPTISPNPIAVWVSTYEKISPKALPVNFKISQGLNSTLAKLEAVENNCGEALLLNANGCICECSSSNIFWLKGGVLHTPSLETGALAGVTRAAILELSPYQTEESFYTLNDIKNAEAVVITNSIMGAHAVNAFSHTGYSWRSEALAQELNQLLERDRIS